MSTHAASVKTSPRLKKVFKLLMTGKEYSTRQISRMCDVYAVNSIVDELRDNGLKIPCERRGRNFYYRLII